MVIFALDLVNESLAYLRPWSSGTWALVIKLKFLTLWVFLTQLNHHKYLCVWHLWGHWEMSKGKEIGVWEWNSLFFTFTWGVSSFFLACLEIGHVSHLQQPSAWKHKTITFISDQHTPETSAVLLPSLPSSDEGAVCFFNPFISLYSLSLSLIFPSSFPTLPWPSCLSSFSSFFFFFLRPFLLGAEKICFLCTFSPFLSVVCFYDIFLPACFFACNYPCLCSPIPPFGHFIGY